MDGGRAGEGGFAGRRCRKQGGGFRGAAALFCRVGRLQATPSLAFRTVRFACCAVLCCATVPVPALCEGVAWLDSTGRVDVGAVPVVETIESLPCAPTSRAHASPSHALINAAVRAHDSDGDSLMGIRQAPPIPMPAMRLLPTAAAPHSSRSAAAAGTPALPRYYGPVALEPVPGGQVPAWLTCLPCRQ